MSTLSHPEAISLPSAEEVYRIPIELYDRIVEQGDIGEDRPIELLSGVLVWKRPKGPRHDASAARCRRAIERILEPGLHLRVESAIRIPDYSEPEPDLSIVWGDIDDYTDHHPGPTDVALIIEIAESSLAHDRGEKRDIYARAAIPVYWVVNLAARQVEVSALPVNGAYSTALVLGEEDFIDLIIDGKNMGRIAVADLLPKGS